VDKAFEYVHVRVISAALFFFRSLLKFSPACLIVGVFLFFSGLIKPFGLPLRVHPLLPLSCQHPLISFRVLLTSLMVELSNRVELSRLILKRVENG